MKTFFSGNIDSLRKNSKILLLLSLFVGTLLSGSANAGFIDRGTGVVFDNATSLDWEKAPLTNWVNYADAHAYINSLTLDGGGWRLPTMDELFDLYKHISAVTGCTDCSGDQGLFEGLTLGYWTTSTYWAGQDGAFFVGFWRGPNDYAGLFQTSSAGVIAVRDGMPISEPGSLVLLGIAALSGMLAVRRRKSISPQLESN